MAPHKNQPFLARLRFAVEGLKHGLRTEHSLRVQITIFGLVLAVLVLLRPEPLWWGLVILASSCVVGAELFNTTLEHLVDHLHPQVHPQIRNVKDCAAAAVLIATLGAVGVSIALLVHLLRPS